MQQTIKPVRLKSGQPKLANQISDESGSASTTDFTLLYLFGGKVPSTDKSWRTLGRVCHALRPSRNLGYPEVSAHAKHHLQTILSLDQLIIGIDHGDTIEPSAAHRCFHEIVKGLLEPDMEFARWAATHSDSFTLSMSKDQSLRN